MKKLAQAIKVANEYGYRVLREDVYTSNFRLNQRIKEYLENDKFIVVLLMGMYGRQVSAEKGSRRTILKNFRGFNQTDAGFLSPLAEKVERGETLTADELRFVKRRLQTYKNTQWSDVLTEMGYVKVVPKPGRKVELFFDEDEFMTLSGVEPDTVVPNAEADYVAKALSLAQEDGGMIDDDDLPRAKQIAAELYNLGLVAPQDAADRINEEL